MIDTDRIASFYFENSPDALLVLEDDRIVDANPAILPLFGYTMNDFRGKSIPDISPELQENGRRSSIEWKTASEKISDHTEIVAQSWRFRVRNRGILESDIRIQKIAQTRPAALIVIVRDNTQHKIAERLLRQRTAQLYSTLESLPFDFWMNDTENRTILQNPYSRKLWGDKTGTRPEDVTDDAAIVEQWSESNRRALAGEVVRGEITYRIDGENRTFRNMVAPIHDRAGNGDQIIGILGLNIDITDYKQAVRDRELLLQELHHRVKNNLQLILSMISLQTSDDNEACSVLDRIRGEIYSIYLVHEQLYTSGVYDRVDAGAYMESLATAAVQAVIHTNPAKISTHCEAISGHIEKVVPLGIIANELITNCLKHAHPPAGEALHITVTFRRDEPSIVLEISDNGRPNDRIEASAGTSGLGLTLVHSLVDQLRGTISVEPGTGFPVSIAVPTLT